MKKGISVLLFLSLIVSINLLIFAVNLLVVASDQEATAPNCQSGEVVVPTQTQEIVPTSTPSVEYVYDPLITPVSRYVKFSGTVQPVLQIMPGGQIIDVREREICQETDIYGSPRSDSIVLGHLTVGQTVVTHELYNGWAMLHAAHWIPETAMCQ